MAAMTKTEFKKLLQAVDVHSPFGPREYFMLVFLFHTGLRISELCGLNVKDVAWQGQPRDALYVRKDLGKGKKSRIVPLNEVAQKAVAKLLLFAQKRGFSTEPESPLLTNRHHERVTARSIQRLMVALREKAGLSVPATCHGVRHLFATELTRATGNPRYTQKVLGHQRLETLDIYDHPTREDLVRAVATLARRTGT